MQIVLIRHPPERTQSSHADVPYSFTDAPPRSVRSDWVLAVPLEPPSYRTYKSKQFLSPEPRVGPQRAHR
eukprot:scaffold51745_cov30-Prasinocladus_malaysianus.AAC.1